MNGVNKVILIGRLGKDPEVRYTPGGSAVANLSLATSETWKDKQTGERMEKTEWHTIVFWNRLAEIASEYLKKGSEIYVEGSLYTEKWQDKNGNDRYTTKIKGASMQMLGGRNNGGGNQASQSNSGGNSSSGGSAPPDAGFDDDIPF